MSKAGYNNDAGLELNKRKRFRRGPKARRFSEKRETIEPARYTQVLKRGAWGFGGGKPDGWVRRSIS